MFDVCGYMICTCQPIRNKNCRTHPTPKAPPWVPLLHVDRIDYTYLCVILVLSLILVLRYVVWGWVMFHCIPSLCCIVLWCPLSHPSKVLFVSCRFSNLFHLKCLYLWFGFRLQGALCAIGERIWDGVYPWRGTRGDTVPGFTGESQCYTPHCKEESCWIINISVLLWAE